MGLGRSAAVLAIAGLLLVAASARAQEPVRAFDQLDTRLKPGVTVWVTDAQGREVKGRIRGLAPDAITLDAGGSLTLRAADVKLVEERRGDPLGNGALIGLAAGAGLGGLGCLTGAVDATFCAWMMFSNGLIGAGIGVGIDAAIKGPKLAVYRAPGADSSSRARLSVAPLVTPRVKGVALSFAF